MLPNCAKSKRIQIQWMIELYNKFPDKAHFFDRSQSKEIGDINKLAGTDLFRQQVEAGKSVQGKFMIPGRPGLSAYKAMRKKYLLYQ